MTSGVSAGRHLRLGTANHQLDRLRIGIYLRKRHKCDYATAQAFPAERETICYDSSNIGNVFWHTLSVCSTFRAKCGVESGKAFREFSGRSSALTTQAVAIAIQLGLVFVAAGGNVAVAVLSCLAAVGVGSCLRRDCRRKGQRGGDGDSRQDRSDESLHGSLSFDWKRRAWPLNRSSDDPVLADRVVDYLSRVRAGRKVP